MHESRAALKSVKTKLALGTSQFGMTYGIANQAGQTSVEEVDRIINIAQSQGMDTIDTAIAYGQSEQVLGIIGVNSFKVVSKLPPLNIAPSSVGDWVFKQVVGSLARLQLESLYGLLLHRPGDLSSSFGVELAKALQALKSEGLVRKVGVSIYNPQELGRIWNLMHIDLIQAPLNLIDRKLEQSGWLSRLKEARVEIHTRSAFLQGLLLMQRGHIPSKFEHWSRLWDRWHRSLRDLDVSAAVACLSYPLGLKAVDRVVVGVETADQLRELLESEAHASLVDKWQFMSQDCSLLLDPSKWKSL